MSLRSEQILLLRARFLCYRVRLLYYGALFSTKSIDLLSIGIEFWSRSRLFLFFTLGMSRLFKDRLDVPSQGPLSVRPDFLSALLDFIL